MKTVAMVETPFPKFSFKKINMEKYEGNGYSLDMGLAKDKCFLEKKAWNKGFGTKFCSKNQHNLKNVRTMAFLKESSRIGISVPNPLFEKLSFKKLTWKDMTVTTMTST